MDITTTTATAADPVTRTRPRLVLAICCMSLLIVGMDVTIVNVALPSIQRDLDAPIASLQWTTAAYTVVLASLLLLGGSLADRLGRARVFKVGLALFTAASLACSRAHGALRTGVPGASPAPARSSRPDAGHPHAGDPDLGHHRGPPTRLGLAVDRRPRRHRGRLARDAGALRAAPGRSAHRAALLRQ